MSTNCNEQENCESQQAERQEKITFYNNLAESHKQIANAYIEKANSFR